MKIYRNAAVMTAIALFGASGAQAQLDEETTGDLRCILVSTLLLRSDNPTLRSGAPTMMGYFLGRLDGHDPKADLKGGLLAELSKTTPQTTKDDLIRCGQLLKERGDAVTEVGQAMRALAEKPQP